MPTCRGSAPDSTDCPYPQGCHYYENARAPEPSAQEVYDNGYCQPPLQHGRALQSEQSGESLRYSTRDSMLPEGCWLHAWDFFLKGTLERLHTLLICFLHRKLMVMYPIFQLKEMNIEVICQRLNKRLIILLLLLLCTHQYGCFFTAALKHTRQLFKDKTCWGQHSVPAESAFLRMNGVCPTIYEMIAFSFGEADFCCF